VLLLVVGTGLFAQRIPEKAVDPSGRSRGDVQALLQRAERLESVDAELALALALEAIEIAPDAVTRWRAQLRRASVLRRLGSYEEAMVVVQAVEGALPEGQNDLIRAQALYLIGRLHWNRADYASSIEVHLQELRLAVALGDALALSEAHTGLGLTYVSFGQSDTAYAHLLEARKWAESSGDRNQFAITLNSLGNFNFAQQNYDLARRQHEHALQLRRAERNVRGIGDSLNNLALISAATGDPVEALSLLGEAEAIYQRLGLKRYIANLHRRTGAILTTMGRYDEALVRLSAGLEIAQSLGSAEVLANLYRELVTTYEARGDFAAALQYEKRRGETVELSRTETDRKLIHELNVRYQAERREHEIGLLRRDQALQQAEIDRRKLLGWFAGGGLVVMGVVVVSLFRVQRLRLRESNRLQSATENARDRAEDADRLKSRLLQIASHDLKAPLAAFRATARRVEDEAESADIRRLATIMRADSTRMEVLVRDLLDSTALEAASLRLDYTEFDIDALVVSVVDLMQPLAVTKSQSLQTQLKEEAMILRADRDRVWQILVNLVSNALKFTPSGGDVVVRTASLAEWISLEVEDNGLGLSPADIATVYGAAPLSAAKSTDGEHSSGLGLGITRELVALHRGRLEVESQPGAGSVFRVLLPQDGTSAQPAL
jgi:signal transduction histidine kinase